MREQYGGIEGTPIMFAVFQKLLLALQILNSSYAGQYRPLVLAGAVFATVPIIVFYIIFQRRIIRGVTMSGMGGR